MTTTRKEEKNNRYYYRSGCNLYNQEKFNEAINAFNQCLSLKSDDIDALYMRGRRFEHLKRHEEAQADFDRVIQCEPKNHYAHYLYGVSLYTIQKYQESLTTLNECLTIKPDYAHAYVYQGWAYVALKQYDEASLVFKKAIELQSTYNIYYNFGIALYSMKQYEEAIIVLNKSIDLNSNYYHSYYYKGLALHVLHKTEEAAETFKRCIEVAPDSFDAWYRYAIGLSYLEKYKECLLVCEEALKRCVDYPPVVRLKKESDEKVKSLQQSSLKCTPDENTKKDINLFYQLIKSAIEEEEMLERQQRQITALEQKVQKQAEQLVMLQQEMQEIKSKAITRQQFKDEMLLDAAKARDFNKMDLAIQMGANLEITDQEGLTPLFCSLLNHHYDLANFFLHNKASLKACNKQDETILHVMSRIGDIESVKFILSHFPKDDGEAKVLLSVHDLVSRSEDDKSANATEIKQLIANEILYQAAKQGNINLAKIAMEKGANKDAQDEHSETALHKACYLDKGKMIQFLLEKGCSITKKDKNGQTPIEVTSKPEIKELILNYQRKHATVIQANIRGFFGRKKYDDEKEKYWNGIQKRSIDIFSKLASDGDYDSIAKLANAIKETRLHDAMQIIRDPETVQLKPLNISRVK